MAEQSMDLIGEALQEVFTKKQGLKALLEMLARFIEDAQAMSRAVRWGDAAYIEDKVERGRKIRRSLIELKQA